GRRGGGKRSAPRAEGPARGGEWGRPGAGGAGPPATLDTAVADTGPYFSLSGRSMTVYPPNAMVPSRTSAAPATARIPLAEDSALGPAITATPARATPLPSRTRRPTRSPRKT